MKNSVSTYKLWWNSIYFLNISRRTLVRYYLLPVKELHIGVIQVSTISHLRLFLRTPPKRFFFSSPIGHYSNLLLDFNMAENKFQAEYASTGRSSCKKCKQKIEKGELRLCKLSANIFHEGEGEMKQCYHPKCLFDTFIRARSTTKIIEEPDDMDGFLDLKQEDKDVLNKLIKGKVTTKLYKISRMKYNYILMSVYFTNLFL